MNLCKIIISIQLIAQATTSFGSVAKPSASASAAAPADELTESVAELKKRAAYLRNIPGFDDRTSPDYSRLMFDILTLEEPEHALHLFAELRNIYQLRRLIGWARRQGKLKHLITTRSPIHGFTALHTLATDHTAHPDDSQIAGLLVGNGLAVDALDNYGRTALYYADENKRNDLIHALKSLGANTELVKKSKDAESAAAAAAAKEAASHHAAHRARKS